MRARCATARVDTRAVLRNHALMFGGFSARWGGPVATLMPARGAQVEGLLYVLQPEDLRSLDRHEGHPFAYRRARFAVTDENGRRLCAQVYLQALPNLVPQAPAPDYARVLRGAYKRLGFDASRLAAVCEVH
jgi:gamma-glutamylcyclotransferase (GGCT)/AIG2-like uncharacterized protein YtfP